MELKTLQIKDKPVFDKFFRSREHLLSVYAFQNLYIWTRLFDISWAIIDSSLCIFFRDSLGCFLYLPPQGASPSPKAVNAAFEIMDKYNKQRAASRIENIDEKEVEFYKNLGFECREKFPEYLCQRKDLVELEGARFKSKRATLNYFQKHYDFEYIDFTLRHGDECLGLYDHWSEKRREKYNDPVYQGMLADSRRCLEVLLDNFAKLDFTGRIVKIESRIRAFTLGFPLSRNTFCILYEISDLTIKGLSQYIFRRFCAEQKNYRYINIMDDSGLGNLKEVKLSYRPYRLVPSFIAKRLD